MTAAETVDPKKQLIASLKYLENRFGRGIVMDLNGIVDKKECIPSGHPYIDWVLGGGFFFGKHIEIYGYESSGKSTISYGVAARCQRLKYNTGRVLILDYENSWSKTYFKRLGGLTDADHLLVSQPDTAEDGLEVMREFIDHELVDLIIVDSVSAMLPKAEEAIFADQSGKEVDSGSGKQKGQMGTGKIGSQSLMMSQGLKQLSARINKKKVCVIWINQVRTKINTTGGNTSDTTSGGNALRFYAAVRLELRKIGALKGKIFDPFENKVKEGVVAIQTIVKGAKNKEAPPFREAPVLIRFGTGLDVEYSILEFATKHGIVTKSKNGVYTTQALGAKRNARGLEDFRKLMKEEPGIWKTIVGKCDFEKAMDDAQAVAIMEEDVPETALPEGFSVTSGEGEPVDVDALLGTSKPKTIYPKTEQVPVPVIPIEALESAVVLSPELPEEASNTTAAVITSDDNVAVRAINSLT